MNLLIADDEQIIRAGLLSLPWNTIGIENVYAVENGFAAKKKLDTEAIDILISDIKMPGMTGLELAEYITEYSLDTAVILLTGFSDFEYARRAIKNRVWEYMLKPLRPGDILHTVLETKIQLERRRNAASALRRYEKDADAEGYREQIVHHFHDVSPQAMEILQDMALHFNQGITLNSLADKYHFSVGYLSRMIKKETGYSFSDILIGIRIAAAARKLMEDSARIHLICERVGFSDQKYFSQVFRRVFSCSPREFRKQEADEKTYHIKRILDIMQDRKEESGISHGNEETDEL